MWIVAQISDKTSWKTIMFFKKRDVAERLDKQNADFADKTQNRV